MDLAAGQSQRALRALDAATNCSSWCQLDNVYIVCALLLGLLFLAMAGCFCWQIIRRNVAEPASVAAVAHPAADVAKEAA
jgi:hypothetical protein